MTIILCDQCGRTFVPTLQDENRLKCDMQDELRERFLPTDTESSQIIEDIRQLDGEITQYNLEIDRLRETLGTLEKRRDILLRAKETRQALFSPIRKLPPEVLGEILSLCAHLPERNAREIVSLHDRGYKRPLASLSLPILSVARTCRLWRDICLEKPDFWTDIVFHFDSMYETSYSQANIDALTSLLRRYLGHSNSLPLNVNFHALGPYGTDWDWDSPTDFHELCSQVLVVLLEESQRWQSVVLAIDSELFALELFPHEGVSELIECFSQTPSSSFPRLESFVVVDQSLAWQSSFVRYFSAAPIRNLLIPSYSDNLLDTLSEAHSLIDVTSLTVSQFDNACCSILEHCPNLERLNILNCLIVEEEWAIHTCPKLANLEVSLSDGEPHSNVTDLFEVLNLPSVLSRGDRKAYGRFHFAS
ncbi:hypothetical protein D9758_011197 [Tetrapyrgos nigripes]|uniref:F-box domain-containing protein n=1 Tax=Tetrapyrgos nigripes TaxID=182062 RepID=A0A8H5D7G2_9AGAR|nr:hypothetical protein D9758_011197 [Tetrapyrgos nigripes]